MPFNEFLGPSSESTTLTRILRRRSLFYHNYTGYTSDYSNRSDKKAHRNAEQCAKEHLKGRVAQ